MLVGESMPRKRYLKMKEHNTSNPNHDGSGIINLNNLNEHLQVITQHAATCQPCADNVLSDKQAHSSHQ